MLRPHRQGTDGSVGEILSFDSKGVVEAGPGTLHEDRGCQFDQLRLGKFLPQAGKQCVYAGVKSSKTYTVREAVEDWLREGLDGTSERTRTLYEGLLGPLLDAIGARPLRVLSAGDVRSGLSQLAARYSTRFADHPTLAGASDPAARRG